MYTAGNQRRMKSDGDLMFQHVFAVVLCYIIYSYLNTYIYNTKHKMLGYSIDIEYSIFSKVTIAQCFLEIFCSHNLNSEIFTKYNFKKI